jgi:hypothetical protein
MRPVEVDFDNPAHVERVWQELRRYHEVRGIDPELRGAIERRCQRLERAQAEPILHDLDRIHPEAVLEAHFTALVPNMRTCGFWLRHLDARRAAEAALGEMAA